MLNRNWHDRVRRELLRQGLPQHYVARLSAELADHAADLFKEDLSMEAEPILEVRLGHPADLAQSAKTEFQARSFAGRHPWLTFIAAPILVISITMVGTFALLAGAAFLIDAATSGVLSANDHYHGPPSLWEMRLMNGADLMVRLVPFWVSGLLFLRLGQRTGHPTWSIGACVITAAIAAAFVSAVTPATPDGPGMWTLGFGWKPGIRQLIQASIPLICALWIFTQIASRRLRTQLV